ncbi:MAG: hypothetical protein HXS44_12875 [Theionarchaea archaeon]|nr:hypothetical protein [Theionarchaea archaeon]
MKKTRRGSFLFKEYVYEVLDIMAKLPEGSAYEEIRKVGKKGRGLTLISKIFYLEELLRKNRIQKTNSQYSATKIIPSCEIFATVEKSSGKGAALLPLRIHVVKWDGRNMGLYWKANRE